MSSELVRPEEQEDRYGPLLPLIFILIGLGVLYLVLAVKKRPARLSFRQYQRNVAAGRIRAAAARRAAEGTFLPDILPKSWARIVK